MFEKEAEEIEKEAIKWVKDVFPNDEFKQSGISRALVEFAELGYNKANEWHYVKNGDLPRQYEHTCFSIDVLANNKKWVYYEFSSGKWFCGNKEVNVIAWKEITLPAPPKEIEEKND